jgi:hypothetical protein
VGGVVQRARFLVWAMALILLLLVLSYIPGVGGTRIAAQGEREKPPTSVGAWEGGKAIAGTQPEPIQISGAGGRITVNAHVVPSEHIVQFKEYLSEDEQKSVLDETLGAGSWAVVPVSRPFTHSSAPSDFITIKTKSLEAHALKSLEAHGSVKRIVPEKRLVARTVSTDSSPGGEGQGGGRAKVLGGGATGRRRGRRLLGSISDKYNAQKLWAKGFKGAGVRVAVFDTGNTSAF